LLNRTDKYIKKNINKLSKPNLVKHNPELEQVVSKTLTNSKGFLIIPKFISLKELEHYRLTTKRTTEDILICKAFLNKGKVVAKLRPYLDPMVHIIYVLELS
jgi:hypothetical protein